jgi:hypothetical protein
MWAICKAIVATMNSMVKQCIVNQIKGYMLFSNALNVTLFISVLMHNEIFQFKVNSCVDKKGFFIMSCKLCTYM